MKFRKSILYLLVSAMLISLSAPVYADEIVEGETATENTELNYSENDLGDDLFDSIIGANEQEKEETDENEAEVEQKKETELSKRESLAVSLMKAIGVLDKNADLSSDFTRAKLAHAVYVLKDFNMFSESAINIFADVDANTQYANEISVLYDIGYISGDMGSYRPYDTVTAAEMAVVLTRVLGLEFIADMNGGWPAGYLNVANQYDIFDGVSVGTDKAVTTLQAAVIFENLLNAKIDFENMSGIQGYYMSAVLNIKSVEGILTDNGITSLDGSETVKGRIKIGTEEYNANGIACEDYIGKKVKAYFYDIDADDLYILAIEDTEKLDTIRISCEDIEDFKDRTYEYKEKTRTEYAPLATDYSIIYNGRLVTDGTKLTDEMLKPDEGFVELIDQNSDDKYDLVIIEDYITFVVEGYNSTENILRPQDKAVAPIEFEEADLDIKMFLASGDSLINVDYQNIAHNGYVLSVARSLDNRVVKIYLAEEIVTGYVGGFDVDEKTVSVDGKEYIASRKLNVSIGGSYKLNINHYGHIIWGERTERLGDKYAYVEKVYFDDSGESLFIKLYTEDNSSLTAPLAAKVEIDGKTYTDPSKAETALQNAVSFVVIFRINSNDEVVKIDTSALENGEKTDSSLNVLYQNTSVDANTRAGFDYNTLSFGTVYQSKYPTAFNTKVFCAKTPYESGMIYCYSLADFKNTYVTTTETEIGKLWLYNTDADSIIGRVALIKRDYLGQFANDGESQNNLRTGSVVTKIRNAVNEDGEEEYLLTVECNGKEENIRIEFDALTFNTTTGAHTVGGNNPYSIGCGDIIRWGINDEGFAEAGNVVVLYDCDREWYNSSNKWTNSNKYQNRWHYLWVYDKEEDHLLSVSQSSSPVEKFHNGEKVFDDLYTYVDYTVPLNGQPISIWVYDKVAKELRKGDLGDIETYKDSDIGCTKMMARYNSGHRLCIIYK